MKRKTFHIVLLICLFSSCNQAKKATVNALVDENTKYITINLDDNIHEVKDAFTFNHFIALETTEESLISDITKIELDDYIYILDSKQETLFIFNLDGTFSHKIFNLGQSPEEYISATDFYLDGVNKHIYILDGVQGYILIYDINGKFLEREQVAKGYSFDKLNDRWFLYLGNGAADHSSDKVYQNLVVYDQNFNIENQYLPFNTELLGRRYTCSSALSIFSKYRDEMYVLPLHDYNIYKYNTELSSLKVDYAVSFKGFENLVLDDDASATEVEKYLADVLMNLNVPTRLHSFYKLENGLFFGFLYKSSRYYSLYNEEEKTTQLFRMGHDENGIIFSPDSYVSKDNSELILSCLDGELFHICKELDKTNNTIINEIDKAIGSIEDPNPILLFYDIK